MRSVHPAPILAIVLVAQGLPAQDPADLAAVLAAESQRVEVTARVARAVCSVMPMDSPGGGSGVIFDPLGFVLTNFHVVGKPDVKQMKVGLPDGALYVAEVLGVDPGSDLAVLLLEPPAGGERAWPYAPIGTSHDLLVGQAVMAMGNPFLLATDFAPTVTFGIVSGTHRYQPGPQNRALVYPDCIQVDVPINPGNSGGPLFDLDGRIIGINGRISVREDRGRVNTGVGFAIAADQIRNFLPDLMAGRFAEHGTLDMNAWFMRAPGEDERHGVFVQGIFADSAVTGFGIQLGDEITHLDGIRIRSANQLATLVGVLPAGTWVDLGFCSRTADGFGPEQTVTLPLRRLDTGSSREEDRLASREVRQLALRALARGAARGEPTRGATLRIEGPDGDGVTIHRLEERLRLEYADHVLIRRDADDAFHIASDGTVREASAEERAKLDRVWSTNPWLWRGAQFEERLLDAALDGGAMAFGHSVFRARLPADGEREMWFRLDGTPTGFAYRDPVQRAKIECWSVDGQTRVVKDGVLVPGWSLANASFEAPDPTLFERPSQ